MPLIIFSKLKCDFVSESVHREKGKNNSHLFARIHRGKIHFLVVLGSDVVQTIIVPEGAPFHVDNHLFRVFVIAIPSAHAIQFLHVTGVRSGPKNQTDRCTLILVRTGHQRADRIVDQGDALNVQTLKCN